MREMMSKPPAKIRAAVGNNPQQEAGRAEGDSIPREASATPNGARVEGARLLTLLSAWPIPPLGHRIELDLARPSSAVTRGEPVL